MSAKQKSEWLYKNLKAEREKLVKKYEANGYIRYDVACGMVKSEAYGLGASIADMSVAPGNQYIFSADPTPNAGVTAGLGKEVQVYREDVVAANAATNFISGSIPVRVVPDFDAIGVYNSEKVQVSSMKDAFEKRAANKVVLLFANDFCLRFGGILLWEVPCLLRIMDTLNPLHNGIFPQILNTGVTGRVHSLANKVEEEAMTLRGSFKPVNYRGDADWLNHPNSLWSQKDKSGQSIYLLGVNSLIRMWGRDQVIDLNGKTVNISERPNLVAGFSAIIDLADGHFSGLSSKGAYNAHIYSSTGLARLGRNNHFAIRGHFVHRLLAEGFQSGERGLKNRGSYFGTAIFNDSTEIVFKDVHQEQLIRHVPRSSLGLSWYADLFVNELLFAKNIRSADWDLPATRPTRTAYRWLKWTAQSSTYPAAAPVVSTLSYAPSTDLLSRGASDSNVFTGHTGLSVGQVIQINALVSGVATIYRARITAASDSALTLSFITVEPPILSAGSITSVSLLGYDNGRQTPYPIIKSASELETEFSITSAQATQLRDYLIAAQEAYRASTKNADDVYIQVNVNHNRNAELGASGNRGDTNPAHVRFEEMPRTTNLVVANPPNRSEGNYYPDSMAYGFRAGSAAEGVGNLANNRNSTCQDVYLIDCTFEGIHTNMMEAVSLHGPAGVYKTFNGQALRPLGYSNNRNPAAGIAASSMHVSQAAIRELLELSDNADLAKALAASLPYAVDDIDTAAKAYTNKDQTDWKEEEKYSATQTDAEKQIHGLYKGHDVLESSLATITALAALLKYVPQPTTSSFNNIALVGLNNTNLDIGILAWRQSMMNALGAYTANHVGLKGGYWGDLRDRLAAVANNVKNDGEIYPWMTKANASGALRLDGTLAPTIIDKDADYANALAVDATSARRDLILEATGGYVAARLPKRSNDLFKFEFELIDTADNFGGVKCKLVHAVSGAAVTYAECATLLGFDSVGVNKPSGPVEYVFLQNFDGQNHVHKGSFGIRFDQIANCGAIHCRVADFETVGFHPEPLFVADKETAEAVGISDPQRPASNVNDIHGLSINGVTNCYIEDFEAAKMEGLGDIYGAEVQGGSKNVEIQGLSAKTLHAGQVYGADPDADSFGLSGKQGRFLSFDAQRAIGLRVSEDCKDVKINGVSAEDLVSPAAHLAKKLDLEVMPKM